MVAFIRWSLLPALALLLTACGGGSQQAQDRFADAELVAKGKQIFRFDTFGDETQWTDALRMHEVIAAAVDPVTALSVGLKVDAEALPEAVKHGIADGSVDLNQNLYRGGWVNGRLASQRLTGQWYSRAGLLWRVPRQRHRLDLRSFATKELGPDTPPATQPLTPAALGTVVSLEQAGRPTARVRRQADALAALVRQLAATTPRAGKWERTYRALQARARATLDMRAAGNASQPV